MFGAQHRLRSLVREIPIARKIYHLVNQRGRHGRVLTELPAFLANSAAPRAVRADLTLLAANDTFPLLLDAMFATGHKVCPVIEVHDFDMDDQARRSAVELAMSFDRFGSDKATPNGYHHIYGSILADLGRVETMLEVGLGSNNPQVPSNMGREGKPGASLRAFKDCLADAAIYGADVDKDILFTEERIQTFFVDQTDLDSVRKLGEQLPQQLDLIIDDGLHAPNANLAILLLAMSKLRQGGWLVIEDILPATITIWQVVSSVLAETFDCRLVDMGNTLVFCAKLTDRPAPTRPLERREV